MSISAAYREWKTIPLTRKLLLVPLLPLIIMTLGSVYCIHLFVMACEDFASLINRAFENDK